MKRLSWFKCRIQIFNRIDLNSLKCSLTDLSGITQLSNIDYSRNCFNILFIENMCIMVREE